MYNVNPNLEINLLYWSGPGRETSFTSIVNLHDSLDPEDLEPERFWMLMGGFEVTLDGYKTIFHSSDFHYLVKATSFLIHSLYWIKAEVSDWFDKDDLFPDDVTVKSSGGNLIRLKHDNNNFLKFSYTPPESHPYKRGERFFEEVKIDKQQWFRQADVALSEYFDILIRVANQNVGNETSKVMLEYYSIWKKISNLN